MTRTTSPPAALDSANRPWPRFPSRGLRQDRRRSAARSNGGPSSTMSMAELRASPASTSCTPPVRIHRVAPGVAIEAAASSSPAARSPRGESCNPEQLVANQDAECADVRGHALRRRRQHRVEASIEAAGLMSCSHSVRGDRPGAQARRPLDQVEQLFGLGLVGMVWRAALARPTGSAARRPSERFSQKPMVVEGHRAFITGSRTTGLGLSSKSPTGAGTRDRSGTRRRAALRGGFGQVMTSSSSSMRWSYSMPSRSSSRRDHPLAAGHELLEAGRGSGESRRVASSTEMRSRRTWGWPRHRATAG
jgi:hypothetical protein